jgi:hypothetical protein
VQVGSEGNIARFELRVESDRQTPGVRVTQCTEHGVYQNARVLIFDTKITGETSLSDDEILAKGTDIRHTVLSNDSTLYMPILTKFIYSKEVDRRVRRLPDTAK